MTYVALDREQVGDATVFVLRMVDEDNRFHADSVAEWHAAIDEVEASTGPAALVTTGNGKFYSNGFALERLIEEGTIGVVIPDALHLFARLLRLPVYSVAAINGHAFAAGAMMAMAHDARVMREDRGWWSLPEADMGVPLSPGMTQLIAAKLPIATAHAAVVTAKRWTGPEAVPAGIADEVAAEDQVLPRALELAAARAHTDRTAIVALRTGLYGPLLETLDRADLP
jgi:enoyl-CoA hydratase/carnithine racemase